MRVHLEKILTGEGESFACREFRCRSFNAPFHFHPEFELTLILSGSGRRFVADSIEEFRSGDLVLLGPNLPHRWASAIVPAGGRMSHSIVLQFRQDCFGGRFWDIPEFRPVRRLLDRSVRGLCCGQRVAADIAARMKRLRLLEGPERALCLLDILHRLSRSSVRSLASRNWRLDIAAHDVARIDRVITFVEGNFSDEMLNLSQAARIATLTPGAFSRFFKRSTGRTFVSFVNRVRLNHVCRLLVETGLPVAEICFACGYGTMSNFHQRFLLGKRTTPLAYRRMFASAMKQIPERFVMPEEGK